MFRAGEPAQRSIARLPHHWHGGHEHPKDQVQGECAKHLPMLGVPERPQCDDEYFLVGDARCPSPFMQAWTCRRRGRSSAMSLGSSATLRR